MVLFYAHLWILKPSRNTNRGIVSCNLTTFSRKKEYFHVITQIFTYKIRSFTQSRTTRGGGSFIVYCHNTHEKRQRSHSLFYDKLYAEIAHEGRCKIYKERGPGFGDFGPLKKSLSPPLFLKKKFRLPFVPRKKLFTPLLHLRKKSLPPSSSSPEMKVIYIHEN